MAGIPYALSQGAWWQEKCPDTNPALEGKAPEHTSEVL